MTTSRERLPIALSPGTSDSAEARAFFQGRLALFGGWILLISGGFYIVDAGMRAPFGIEEKTADYFHLLSLVAAGSIFIAGRFLTLSAAAAKAVDAGGTILLCASLAAMCSTIELETPYFRVDPMHALFVGLLACSFTLFARAVAVPSTAWRTGWISVLSMAPMIGAAWWILRSARDVKFPAGVAYADVGAWSVAAVAMAAVASRVIFGLRAEVSKIKRLGQYTLERKLGEGGMGAVYRARHALLRRPTAVKLLPPEKAGEDNIRRFEREVRLTAQLSHPSTVAIFDYGRTPDGVFYYAMEYLDGVDLQQLVQMDGPQPAARVAHILQQVCGALAEAHGVGLMHRDIKPANIILCERGGIPDVAKVVDFGLVKSVEVRASDETMVQTSAFTVVGTPLYLAPEAFAGGWAIDARCDLYALGGVGYYLLTGQPVFTGRTAVEILAHHMNTAPQPPSSRTTNPVPPALDRLLLQCLAKSPADRPADAATVQRELAAAVPAAWSSEQAAEWWKAFRARQPKEEAPAGADAVHATAVIDLSHPR